MVDSQTDPVDHMWTDGTTMIADNNWAVSVSNNTGLSWTLHAEDVGGSSVTGIDNWGDHIVLVKYGSSAWISSDRGANWSQLSIPNYSGFLGIIANDLTIVGNIIYIAHSKGLYIGTISG